ncbi:MAG: hypothetical protein ACXACD_17785, partial [Candidatus Thorarchaeota archaeon]
DEGDFFRRGEIQEKNGHSLHRAAFQAENREEFLEKLGNAVETYKKAWVLYEKSGDENTAWVLRCKAISKYLNHWITSDPSDKLRFLYDCHELERRALDSFWDPGNKLEYCKTYAKLALVSEIIFFREGDQEIRRETLKTRLSWGEKSIEALRELGDFYEKAKTIWAYAQNFRRYSANIEPTARARARQLGHQALKLADEVGDFYMIGFGFLFVDPAHYRQSFEKGLECGEKTRDIFLKAWALGELAWSTYFNAFAIEDPDQRLKTAEEAMEFYDRSQNLLKTLSFQVPSFGKLLLKPAPGGYAEYYVDRAQWETNPEKKLELLEKSEKAGLEALNAAEGLGIPLSIGRVSGILGRTLASRAKLETDIEIKRSLLEKAVEYSERNIEIEERLGTLFYWNHGSFHYSLAEIKEELALIEQDHKKKVELLEDSKSRKEKALNLIYKVFPRLEAPNDIGYLAILSLYHDGHGATLTRLYELTNDIGYLREAIDVWLNAITVAHKVPLLGRIAELFWKIAKTHDIMNDYLDAAENFKQASESYLKAAASVPQLKSFYKDYSNYMQAWSEIENAKYNHGEKQYRNAKEHYEKAAALHDSTERWSYLAPNYQAWARLNEAEDLSRREQTQEARDLFQQAVELFSETEDSIKSKMNTIEVGEEKQIAEELINASDSRRGYCLGRAALEDARVLDRQGDHLASSKRYGQAIERFQGVMDSLEQESDRSELMPIIYLCQAWEKMMLAEARTSPEFYNQAAEIFEQARKHALDQSTSLLAQAHSSFCKALEAGTRFELTRETETFSEAKRNIEAATSQYLRAGYETMSEYAGATSRLLDAYLYSYNAQIEADPQKKAQFYQMAERLLQSSAGSYLKAKHPEKSDEVRRILNRVKEEREIAVSLSEVLHAPIIVSTTTSFATPTPTQEQAVGLERFESADIQANLITRRREVGVGEDLDLEIELVNAGKTPAQLVKVEDIVIPGFELKSYPDICRVEDSYLDMKGRTLSPLKTQELKLVLKPLTKGAFELKP